MQNNLLKHQENESVGKDYFSRLMRMDEIVGAFSLVEQEDWNLTFAKFKQLHKVFPSYIFVTVKKDSQEVVAVISAIPSFPGQYVVGNLVVKTDHRSLGLGKSLFLYLLNHLQHTGPFNATLMTLPGVHQFYSKLGFHAIEPSHLVQHVKVDRPGVNKASSEHNTDDVTISEYTPDMFQALNNYDTEARGYDCGRYLSLMAKISNTFLLAMNKGSGQVMGYAAGVDKPSLLLVDGVYADDDAIALRLYCALLDLYPDQQVIKLQEIEPRCFLSQFGDILPESHPNTRMANGPVAPIGVSKLYIVCDCDYVE